MARFLPLVALFFAALSGATPAIAVTLPVASSLGVQMSLVTGVSRFEIPLDPAQLTRAEFRRSPYLLTGSFVATAALTNLSRSPLALTYPSALAANARFHFILQNSAGQAVWESDATTAATTTTTTAATTDPAPVVSTTVVTLPPRATLRRTIQVPLKSTNGDWLPGGRYHLRAEAGTGDVLASVPIDIVAPPVPEGTGIQGQVFFRQLGVLGPITINPPTDPVALYAAADDSGEAPTLSYIPGPILSLPGLPIPAEATVYISEIRELNARYDHPAFAWTGRTDAQGRFHVATPAGHFHLSASIDGVSVPPSFAPTWLTVSVTQGQFTTQNIEVTGWRVTPKNLVYQVDNASGVPVEGFPGNVLVTARGHVSTGGWSSPTLAVRPSTTPGVIDLDFLATPPTGVSAQVISPITAQTTVSGVTNSTIIHVHSSGNTVTVLIGYPNIPVPVVGL